MSNLRVVYKNAVDHADCVLSCSVAATLPLDNMKNMVRGRIARIPASPAFVIKGTYGGAAIRASMVAALRTNMTLDATWRFRGYGTANWTGSTVADTGVLSPIEGVPLGELDFGVDPLGDDIWRTLYGQKMALAWFDSAVMLSWDLTITDIANSSGVIDISRLWVGSYYEMLRNPSYGMKLAWKENTQLWDTDGGSPRSDAGIPYRMLSFSLDQVDETDRARLFDVLRYCGMRRDLFVCPYPSGTDAQVRDYTLNGIIETLPDITTVNYGRDSTNIVIREV